MHTNLSIGENTPEETIEFAKKLGLSGIGIVRYYPGELHGLPDPEGIDVVNAVMIKPSTPAELLELAKKIRNKTEVLLVHGGNYDINRAACETSMVDILCHPELGRKDSGLDHICIKAASENDVAIEVNFREILESYKRERIYMLSAMKKNIKLCRKYGVNVITSSGSVTKWGMRSGRELASITNILGLELGNAIDSVSAVPESIVSKNREKLAGNRWEGVKII